MSQNTEDRKSFSRWQVITIEQLGYAINLILGLAVTSLGFVITLLLGNKPEIESFSKIFLEVSMLALVASVSFGVFVVINRLRDFRATMEITQMRDNGKLVDETNTQRSVADKLGKQTWCFFKFQVIAFALGAAFAVLSIASLLLHASTSTKSISSNKTPAGVEVATREKQINVNESIDLTLRSNCKNLFPAIKSLLRSENPNLVYPEGEVELDKVFWSPVRGACLYTYRLWENGEFDKPTTYLKDSHTKEVLLTLKGMGPEIDLVQFVKTVEFFDGLVSKYEDGKTSVSDLPEKGKIITPKSI